MLTSLFTTISRASMGFKRNALMLTATLGAVSLLTVSGCNYSYQKGTSAGAADNQKSLPPQVNGEPVFVDAATMRNYALEACTHCHAVGGKNPQLANVDDFRSNFAEVMDETDTDDMPPSKSRFGSLNACQKAIIHMWDQLGKPDTSTVDVSTLPACAATSTAPKPAPVSAPGPGSPPPPAPTKEPAPAPQGPDAGSEPAPAPAPQNPAPPAPPQPGGTSTSRSILDMPVNYQTFLTQILQPKCVACHNEKSDDQGAADILFVPFSMIKQKTRLFAGPSSSSKFVKLVSRTDGDEMPPPWGMPQHLTADELAFVTKWIDAGTPEN